MNLKNASIRTLASSRLLRGRYQRPLMAHSFANFGKERGKDVHFGSFLPQNVFKRMPQGVKRPVGKTHSVQFRYGSLA